MICTLTKYDSGDKIEKNEISRTCSTYGGEEIYIYSFG